MTLRTVVPAAPDAWITALWDRMLPAVDVEQYGRYCLLRIEALNHALRGIPEDRVRYHICWGSWHGPHATDIPLQEILPLVLRIKAGAFVIEAANVRQTELQAEEFELRMQLKEALARLGVQVSL